MVVRSMLLLLIVIWMFGCSAQIPLPATFDESGKQTETPRAAPSPEGPSGGKPSSGESSKETLVSPSLPSLVIPSATGVSYFERYDRPTNLIKTDVLAVFNYPQSKLSFYDLSDASKGTPPELFELHARNARFVDSADTNPYALYQLSFEDPERDGLHFIDYRNGKVERIDKLGEGYRATFSPDNEMIAVYSYGNQCEKKGVALYHISADGSLNRQQKRILEQATFPRVFFVDNNLLAVIVSKTDAGGIDSTYEFWTWDLKTGIVKQHGTVAMMVEEFVVSPNKGQVAYTAVRELGVWNVNEGIIARLENDKTIGEITWSEDSKLLVVTKEYPPMVLEVYQIEGNTLVQLDESAFYEAQWAFRPEGRHLWLYLSKNPETPWGKAINENKSKLEGQSFILAPDKSKVIYYDDTMKKMVVVLTNP